MVRKSLRMPGKTPRVAQVNHMVPMAWFIRV